MTKVIDSVEFDRRLRTLIDGFHRKGFTDKEAGIVFDTLCAVENANTVASTDIIPIIRREIAAALRKLGDCRTYFQIDGSCNAVADQLDPPAAKDVGAKLNPCEKCGADPYVIEYDGHDYKGGMVRCGNFSCRGFFLDIEAWNAANPIKPAEERHVETFSLSKYEIREQRKSEFVADHVHLETIGFVCPGCRVKHFGKHEHGTYGRCGCGLYFSCHGNALRLSKAPIDQPEVRA